MTSDRVVELILSPRGKTMVKVNNFNFYHERRCLSSGLDFWRCSHKLCTAKFYTNESYKIVENESNSFSHNHVLSRTRLVKRLVIKEIKKVLALRGSSMKSGALIAHANRYLQQAFASTLSPSEMENIGKSVPDYCYYYRNQLLANGPSSKSATEYGISNETRRVMICKAAEEGTLMDEDSNLFDSDSSDDDSGSNITVRVFNDTDDVQRVSGNQSTLQTIHDPLAHDCTIEASPPTKKARLQPPTKKARLQPPTKKARLQPPTKKARLQPPVIIAGSNSQNTTTPLLQPMPPVIHLTDGDTSNQKPFDSSKQRVDEEDDDDVFLRNILPLFRMLSQSDKGMIKAQIHQLVAWKLKNSM